MASAAYGYDADGHLTSLNTTGLAGAASNTYTYDQAGWVTSWNNGTTTTNYGYDNRGVTMPPAGRTARPAPGIAGLSPGS